MEPGSGGAGAGFTAYIGLGANLGDPAAQVRAALRALGSRSDTRVSAASSLYRSVPMGPRDQPDYCNAVCLVETALPPRQLLAVLLAIEAVAGRIRGTDRWGPRRLDLDLLHVNGVQLDEPGLRLPHPGLGHRGFVLVPLAEIAPELSIPGLGRIADLVAAGGREGLLPWCDVAGDGSRADAA